MLVRFFFLNFIIFFNNYFLDPANINFINLINQKKSLKPDLNKNYLTSDNLIETNSNLSNQDQLPLPKTSLSQSCYLFIFFF